MRVKFYRLLYCILIVFYFKISIQQISVYHILYVLFKQNIYNNKHLIIPFQFFNNKIHTFEFYCYIYIFRDLIRN